MTAPLMSPEDQQRAGEVTRVFHRSAGEYASERCAAFIQAAAAHGRRPAKFPRSACACRAAEAVLAILGLVQAWGQEETFRRHLRGNLDRQEAAAINRVELDRHLAEEAGIREGEAQEVPHAEEA